MAEHATGASPKDRQERILDAVMLLLSQGGISSVNMRAVAREAGVSLGLVNYHYDDKNSLVAAALRRVEEQDLAILQVGEDLPAEQRLGLVLGRVAEPAYLTTEYLSLRLQLWALAAAHKDFEQINSGAQQRYRAELAGLIRAAKPELSDAECARRAADVDVVQNGLWLTALLGLDEASVQRSVARCEEIALGGDRLNKCSDND